MFTDGKRSATPSGPKKPAAMPPRKQKTALTTLTESGETSKNSRSLNELYGYGQLSEMPKMTPYEHDLHDSYWDKQYA